MRNSLNYTLYSLNILFISFFFELLDLKFYTEALLLVGFNGAVVFVNEKNLKNQNKLKFSKMTKLDRFKL